MLKLFGSCIKFGLFSLIILILGNWLHWNGRTISDQVKTNMAHAEKNDLIGTVRHWAEEITHDAKKGIQKRISRTSAASASIQEEISSSERQKLKALIQELNSTQKKD